MDGLDLGEIDEAERLLVAALRVDRGIVVQLEAIEIEPAFLEAIGTEATLAHLLKVALHGRERERERERAEQADSTNSDTKQQRDRTRSYEIERDRMYDEAKAEKSPGENLRCFASTSLSLLFRCRISSTHTHRRDILRLEVLAACSRFLSER